MAKPLMKDGGCLPTLTLYGAERGVELYNLAADRPATAWVPTTQDVPTTRHTPPRTHP